MPQGCSEFGSKNIFSTVGGPRYDFRPFLKIKLKPGQNGYHSTTFGIPNQSKKVCRPLSCYKNLSLKVISDLSLKVISDRKTFDESRKPVELVIVHTGGNCPQESHCSHFRTNF